jgi:precorrin-6A synthase
MGKKLYAIGIGTGNPEHLTLQAVRVLASVDVVFSFDKGEEKAELGRLRSELCARFIAPRPYRAVAIPDPPRDARIASYEERVDAWHERRLLAVEDNIERELGPDQTGAILVWGDPSLYDSTLRLLERLAARGRVVFEYEVIAGISSPQALAARHKLTLNRIGGAVQVTTGRRLAQALPREADDVVVMLDGEPAFEHVPAEDYDIYWGAYLGTPHELAISGRLETCKDQIAAARAAGRAEHGWIMDIYLLRRRSSSSTPSAGSAPLPGPGEGGIVRAPLSSAAAMQEDQTNPQNSSGAPSNEAASSEAASSDVAPADAPSSDDAYQRKVQKIRDSYEERKAAATLEKGLVAVFTGTGKGKSTAAFGMALRAVQHGIKVGVVQFVKGAIATAETDAFARFGESVEWHRMGEGFHWITQDAELDRKAAARAWEASCGLLARADIGMVVLDEIIVALRLRQLDEAAVLEALKNKREDQHVVLTGRGATKELIDVADLVTEMKMVKHHYRAGVKAQPGIEF